MTKSEIAEIKQKVKGRRVEDISRRFLAKVAESAGHKASVKARKAGIPITKFENGKLVKIFTDGKREFIKIS